MSTTPHTPADLPAVAPTTAAPVTATDLFAGAGGSTTGLTQAGVRVQVAANHWPVAIGTHVRRPGLAERARIDGWLELAARGWALVPVLPGRKQPALARWEQRATTDRERLMRFFSTHPDYNAGIACGPSGLLIVDCDTAKPGHPTTDAGADGWEVLHELATGRGGLPDTFTVATPSGGRHLYFRAPAGRRLGNTVRVLGPMLDSRGHGGQALAPGSRLPNGGYELIDDSDPAPLPGWITRRLSARPSTAVSAAPMRSAGGLRDGGAYVSTARRAELQRVAGAQRGGHNAAVFTAARALGQLAAAGYLDPATVTAELTAAAGHIIAGPCDCTAADIAATIASGLACGARRPRQLPPPSTRRPA